MGGVRLSPVTATHLDHLVFAVPDLEEGIRTVRSLLGAEPVPGGSHPRWGTRNALLSLEPAAYLEIVGPDPDAAWEGRGRGFGVDRLSAPRLVTWALRAGPDHAGPLDELIEAARKAGGDLGSALPGSRRRPDGSGLSWRLTDIDAPRAGGVIPFLIDWGASPHPASTLPDSGCALASLAAVHPEPERVRRVLGALGVTMAVTAGRRPALRAELAAPRGRVVLG